MLVISGRPAVIVEQRPKRPMNAPRSPIRQKSVRDDGAAMLCGISVFAGRRLVRQQPNAFHPASQYRVAQLGNRLLAREGLVPDQRDASMRARRNEDRERGG